MTLSEVFIRRPVLSVVVSLLILLMGLQSAASLAVRQYPKVEDTVITVTTVYAGAASELIQGFITTPIAQAVSSTENIDYVTSSSAQGKPGDAAKSLRIAFQKGSIGLAVLKQRGTLERRLPDYAITWIEFPAGPQLLEALALGSSIHVIA